MRAPTGLTPAPVTTVNAAPTLEVGAPIGHRPHFDVDVIEILPAGGPAEKLRLLRQRSLDAHALCVPFSEQQELSVERQQAEQRLKRLLDPASEGGFGLKDDGSDQRVVAAKKKLAKLTDDLRRLNERSDARTAAWHAASRALAATEEWLRTGRPANCTLETVETELPRPARGETGLLDQIENRRRRVRELRADLHRLESACLPASFAKQRIREQVEALAMRGQIDVSPVVEHQEGKIAWPMQTVRSTVFNSSQGTLVAFAEVADMAAVLAWLHRDALIKRLDQEIDAESDDANALSPEVRAQRESEVLSDLIAVEMQEAVLVFAAQAQGMQIEHRPDITPLALLGCRLITRPHTVPAFGSSPEHAMITFGQPG
jgi:hypothetical protein